MFELDSGTSIWVQETTKLKGQRLKIQVKLSPELYQAGSHFKRQALKILSFTRSAWN